MKFIELREHHYKTTTGQSKGELVNKVKQFAIYHNEEINELEIFKRCISLEQRNKNALISFSYEEAADKSIWKKNKIPGSAFSTIGSQANLWNLPQIFEIGSLEYSYVIDKAIKEQCVCCGLNRNDHNLPGQELFFECKSCKGKSHNQIFNQVVSHKWSRSSDKSHETNFINSDGEYRNSRQSPKAKKAKEEKIENKYGKGIKHNSQIPGFQRKKSENLFEKEGIKNTFQRKDSHEKKQKNLNELGIYGSDSELSVRVMRELGFSMIEFEEELIAFILSSENNRIDDVIKKYGFSRSTYLQNFEYFPRFRKLYFDLYPPFSVKSAPQKFVSDKIKEMYHNLTIEDNKRSLSMLSSNHKEIDIFSEDGKFAVEFNGYFFHNEKIEDDLDKANRMRSAGYNFIALNEIDLLNETRLNLILSTLNINNIKIAGRKCSIKIVQNNEAKDFLNLNHIQGNKGAKIKIGLYYENELVQIMTFGKPRFSKKYNWELIRLATKSGYTVQGGAQKLWSYFKNNHLLNGDTVVSYCDIRYFSGNVYNALNFEKVQHNTSYVWIKGETVLERYSTQKSKLSELLKEGFDENLSENENMAKNGWTKIILLGNDTWVYKK